METIRSAFRAYFGGDVELPADLPPRGEFWHAASGWSVRYVLGTDEQDRPVLDFLAEHRMTNPRHVRLHADGRTETLECYQEGYGYDPKVPGDEDRAQAAYFAYNRRITALLAAKGLADPLPPDDRDDETP